MAAPSFSLRTDDVSHSNVFTVQMTGSGPNGSITLGTTSNPVTLRLYNNYAGAGGIGTAYNVTFSSYDDDTNWGVFSTEPVTEGWLQIKVLNYDGSTTNADTQWYALGGLNKHIMPMNSAQIAGNVSHYVTFMLQVSVPLSTSTYSVFQALWVEYTWV